MIHSFHKMLKNKKEINETRFLLPGIFKVVGEADRERYHTQGGRVVRGYMIDESATEQFSLCMEPASLTIMGSYQ